MVNRAGQASRCWTSTTAIRLASLTPPLTQCLTPASFPPQQVESGTAILSQMGFQPEHVDIDLLLLVVYFFLTLIISFVVLVRKVKERR